MTQKTSVSAKSDSGGLTRVPRTAATSHIHEERFHDERYWREYFSHPAFDFAEALITLRRLRSMSQKELAEAAGTKQPAIARLESGDANPRLSTLAQVARALDATIRLRLDTYESLSAGLEQCAWFIAGPEVLGEPITVIELAAPPKPTARPSEAAAESIDLGWITVQPRLNWAKPYVSGDGSESTD